MAKFIKFKCKFSVFTTTVTTIIASIFFISSLVSCKKDSDSSLVAKWKLIQQFNGYVNGGDFKWVDVGNSNSNTIEFGSNGSFLRTENANGNYLKCSGTYELKADGALEIVTNCNVAVEKFKLTERSAGLIILDLQVREGVIRYKYSVVK